MDRVKLQLSGENLRLQDVYDVGKYGIEDITLDSEAMERVSDSRIFLEREMEQKLIYGVNTGFGPMASFVISREHLKELQGNLIRSHATGMGEAVPSAYVLSAMIVRLNTLLRGYSGVSLDLVSFYHRMVMNGIVPVVPEYGSVGTSGDLVHLAHIALACLGEGEVWYKGKSIPSADALADCGLSPYSLKPKEGLSLINGTSFMSGVASIACVEAQRLLSISLRLGALALELVHAYEDSIHEALHIVRPHPGQINVARRLRDLLGSSRLLRDHNGRLPDMDGVDVKQLDEVYQEVYSLRCIAQILGPVVDVWRRSCEVVQTEINSVTDNPIVDWKRKMVLHGGNFHGEYVATAMDDLKASLVKLMMLSERRINFFLHSKINSHFPPFLNIKQPGLTLALQGLQFVATSMTAQAQSYAYPHRVHSIPTNADNQDVVSMGSDASLFTMRVIDLGYHLLAIETVCLLQAADIVGEHDRLSQSSRYLHDSIRAWFPKVENDRYFGKELQRLVDFLKDDPNLTLSL
jgi:histidine ammonia-lyase